MKKILRNLVIGFGIILFLGGCGAQNEDTRERQTEEPIEDQTSQTPEEKTDERDHSDPMEGMHHGGEIPAGMKDAENPEYPVGTKVILATDHMEGMDGAEATISGAYETTIYEVTYEPTNGGDLVSNHKWVVQEELKDQEGQAKPGDTVILQAEHMEGMKGATATVDNAIQGTAYAVDYTPTNGGEPMEDHMWVTGDEVKPIEENQAKKEGILDLAPRFIFTS
ncbi:MAG: YdhK family protein [Gallicola sp.]|nr:YdhK family protein [Gallicola sp.]